MISRPSRSKMSPYVILKFIRVVLELLQLPILFGVAIVSRVARRPIDVGLGPLPLINNVYHKRALIEYGYSAETFVDSLYFITEDFDKKFVTRTALGRRLIRESHCVFIFAIFRYRCLYLYFTGGPLHATTVLWWFEPLLYRLAGIRTVVMPYGLDVQDLTRTPNLLFRHVMTQDYPGQRLVRDVVAGKINAWTRGADHIISGCDWVDYMYYWDTLMVAHFSIDPEIWKPSTGIDSSEVARSFRVLHAPNHRAVKGTEHFVRAVEELRAEGHLIELILVERLRNDEIRKIMQSVDVVADQLVIGWYAMFSIEGMSMGKPVLCYLRNDLVRLYTDAGLINESEIPLINCTPSSVKMVLLGLIKDRSRLEELGRRGREYVMRHHSIRAVGEVFNRINRSIGVMPGARMDSVDSPKNS